MKKIEDCLHLYLGCEVLYKKAIWRLELLDYSGSRPVVQLRNKTGVTRIFWVDNSKLILRPLSDMTEEERSEADDARGEGDGCDNNAIPEAYEFKYLLSKGFDLFGLIEAGLAISSLNTKNNDK